MYIKIGDKVMISKDYTMRCISFNSNHNVFTVKAESLRNDFIFSCHASYDIFGIDEEPFYELENFTVIKDTLTGLNYHQKFGSEGFIKKYYPNNIDEDLRFFNDRRDLNDMYPTIEVNYIISIVEKDKNFHRNGIFYYIPAEVHPINRESVYADVFHINNESMFSHPETVKKKASLIYSSREYQKIRRIIDTEKVFDYYQFSGVVNYIYQVEDSTFCTIRLDSRPTFINIHINYLEKNE